MAEFPVIERGSAWLSHAALVAADRLGGRHLSTLIFHRVFASPDPLFPLGLDAVRFERLMRIVARSFNVLPLEDAVRRLAVGELPRRALTISFDDGYADNHDVALPILRRLGLPATVFVATAFVDGGRMWNDTVIECLRRTDLDRLELPALGLPPMPLTTLAERRAAIDCVLPQLKYRPPEERSRLLDDLHTTCGSPRLPDDLMLTSTQVRSLFRQRVSIGAHTVNHPILLTLDDVRAEAEMRDSRDQLQAMIGSEVTLFAYPNGRPGKDYDERHAGMARRLGFAAAVSTRVGLARAGEDLFNLPRFTPWQPRPLPWAVAMARHRAAG